MYIEKISNEAKEKYVEKAYEEFLKERGYKKMPKDFFHPGIVKGANEISSETAEKLEDLKKQNIFIKLFNYNYVVTPLLYPNWPDYVGFLVFKFSDFNLKIEGLKLKDKFYGVTPNYEEGIKFSGKVETSDEVDLGYATEFVMPNLKKSPSLLSEYKSELNKKIEKSKAEKTSTIDAKYNNVKKELGF